jgi:hypothetical protein
MEVPTTKNMSRFARTAAEESSDEEIRRRAYELYEARSRGDGHWLEAEAEITEMIQAA